MPAEALLRRRQNQWIAGAIILMLVIGFTWLLTRHTPGLVSATSSGPTVQQIRGLSELVTAKVTVADARETTLSGYLGDVKALLVVRGDALLGPDLSQAKIVSSDTRARPH